MSVSFRASQTLPIAAGSQTTSWYVVLRSLFGDSMYTSHEQDANLKLLRHIRVMRPNTENRSLSSPKEPADRALASIVLLS